MGVDPAAVAVVRRWEEAGGVWRVIARRRDSVTISLRSCTGGEEVERVVSADPELLRYVAGRSGSDD